VLEDDALRFLDGDQLGDRAHAPYAN
jgi:hypothetical protein